MKLSGSIFFSMFSVPADRQINCSVFIAHFSLYQGQVLFLDLPFLEFFLHMFHGGFIFCQDQNPGCVFVQAVYNSGSHCILHGIDLRVSVPENIQYGSPGFPCTGVHGNACWFVNNQKIWVLKEFNQIKIALTLFSNSILKGNGFRIFDFNPIMNFYGTIFFCDCFCVYLNAFVLYHFFYFGAGQAGKRFF